MRRINYVLLFFLCCVASADPYSSLPENQRNLAKYHANRIRDDVATERLRSLAVNTDKALNAMVGVALVELRRRGENEFADQSEEQWRGFQGYLTEHLFDDEYDIGDHKPLVAWLAKFYDAVEKKLGVELCKMLHLSDIKTLNFAIPIVFHPTTFPMDAVTVPRKYEYRDHFAEGQVYYGLMPVVVFWVVTIALDANGVPIGSLIGSAAEWLTAKTIAPRLSDFVYHAAGGQ